MNNDSIQLSEREKDVTELLLQGKSNKQIALALGISASTVEYHLKNVYKKLHVNSRTEAVLRLGKSVGGHRTGELGKSTVEMKAEPADNGGQPISTRRISMNKMFAIIGGVLTVMLVIVFVLVNRPAQNVVIMPTVQASLTPVNTTVPTILPSDSSASAPVVAATSASSTEYMQYVVTADDTCEIISVNFNIPVEAILQKNNLSPTCVLANGQVLLLPLSTSRVHLYEVSNNPPAEFLGEWVAADLKTANLTRVSIQAKNGVTQINMFGNCQPTECNFLEYSPTPALDYNYDSKSGILNVMWIFDFESLIQELTITSDGQLKVITQNHYMDDSGRTDFRTEEYFARQ